MQDFNMEDLTNDDEYVDEIVIDIEKQKIDMLINNMYIVNEKLISFYNEPLEKINDIRKEFSLLCENNRYLIDNSSFIKNLEINILQNIISYENILKISQNNNIKKENFNQEYN